MIVWIDGAARSVETAHIDPRDRGFTLGDGIYETIRVRDGRPLRLERHFARLSKGLSLLDIAPPFGETVLADGILETLAANALSEAAVRLTVTRGAAGRGLAPDPAAEPTVVISASAHACPEPVRVIVATVTRRNEHSPLSWIKSINCLDSVLARIEAARRGAGDAILLNGAGRVAEASAANVFAVRGGVMTTPPIEDGALPGIMRDWVAETMPVEIQSLTPGDLNAAEEVFLTSSLGIRPVMSLDGIPLPIGPKARSLMALLSQT